jgi:hypothetical protein
MKELSTEQKARAYDKAKYIMKKYIESGNAGVIAENTIKNAFPELKESEEDDRIREEIISAVNIYCTEYLRGDKVRKDMIAWLRKHVDKVEQKHTPKHKVGDTIYYNSFGELKSMIVANVTTGGTDNPMYEDENGNAVFEKDLVEQKTPWSKEDERTIKRIDSLLHAINESEFEDIHNWLKSLRPQNSSVTDEELEQAKKDAYNDALDKIEYHSGEPTFDDGWDTAIWYLKKRNAQPQPIWKPSDEQMDALSAINVAGCISYAGQRQELINLYNDLKKLREE